MSETIIDICTGANESLFSQTPIISSNLNGVIYKGAPTTDR